MAIEPDFLPPTAAQTQVGRIVSDLAATQHGVVARWQLLDLLLSRHQIQHLIRAKWLHRIHRTAAAVHGLLRSSSPAAHVTVPATGRTRRRGIVLHQAALPGDERTIVDALPVTTVARTLLDLAAGDDPLLDRAIEEAEHLRLVDIGAIDLETKRPGVRRLRRALEIYAPTPAWTRSHYERRVYKAIVDDGLPAPGVNVYVLGAERDLVWLDHRFVVELDGGPWHDSTAAKIRDPQRDAALQLNDWKVMRVPQHWFDTDPAGVIATIRDYLVSRGERTPARPGR